MKQDQHPRRARPLWQTELTTPARNRLMAVTAEVKEFMQGWALQTSVLKLDFERRLELRGRTRPFKKVELVNLSDGINTMPIVLALDGVERACLQRLATHPRIIWCLHPLVSDTGMDMFEYDSFISIDFPQTKAEIDRAKAAYRQQIQTARKILKT